MFLQFRLYKYNLCNGLKIQVEQAVQKINAMFISWLEVRRFFPA